MLTVHQFIASHFNEKVRWALDYKGLPHKNVRHPDMQGIEPMPVQS